MEDNEEIPFKTTECDKLKKPPGLGARHGQVLMTFLCMVLAYSMRANLSVGIVAMTTRVGKEDTELLPWSLSQQGIILSSFFWGYLVLQMPAGNLSRRLGPKYLLCGALTVCSVATLLSPVIAVHCNWVVFCATRIVNGLAQGFIYPSINTHLSKWATPEERSRMFSFVFAGTQFGTMITMFVAGFLAASAWGWPSIFYVTGTLGVLWAVVWFFIGANSPDTHFSISQEERAYIKTSLVGTSDNSSQMKTPWKKIWRSGPVWAILIAHCGQNWGYWTLLTMMPNYMSHVLKFDIKSNGLFTALPYVLLCVLTAVFSSIADFINARKILPISVSRKMWNSIAHWGGAAALVGLAFVDSVAGTVTLLTISVGLNAATFIGYLTNHLDLSPNFAGLLMGITNGWANITSILGPIVTGYIVQDPTNKSEWMVAFYLAAAVFAVGNLVFIVFGSTEVQPWNEPKSDQVKKITPTVK